MQAHLSSPARAIPLAVILLFVSVAALWFFVTPVHLSGDLVNNLWAPARLLVRGQSPYHTSVLPPIEQVDWLPAVWLPPAIGLFFPLGWLTPHQASLLWLLVSVVFLVVVVWLAQGWERPAPALFGLTVFCVMLFPPTGRHLWLGQFSVLGIVALMVSARRVVEPRYLLAGFLTAVSVAKPQVGLLVIPGLFLAFGRYHRLKGVLFFGGALVLWMALMTIPLWIADLAWIGDLLTAMRQNQEQNWVQPSIFAQLQPQLGVAAWLLWAVVALGVLCANVWLWLRRPPKEAVIWSLALTPFVTPYVWSWDFVLLVPLMVYAVFRFETKIALTLLGFGYLVCWRQMAWIILNTDGHESRLWWIPWLIVSAVCFALVVDGRLSGRKLSPAAER